MKLAAYLAAPRPPFDFVHSDCCRWVDTWVRLSGHSSPMKATGMRYASERAALRRIAEGGGLVALWLKGMSAVGLETCAFWHVRSGAVGVIERPTPCGTDQATGIWTGERWVTLGLRGLDFGPAVPLTTWNL